MAYAAEGFTRGFLGTIQGLTALERAQLEAEDFRERRARAQQFRDITAEELGRVGQLPQTSTGAIQGAVSAPPQMSAIPATEETPSLRQTAGIQEGITRPQATTAPASTTPVSRQDAMLRILERGMAVDPEKAFDITLKGLQLEDVLNTSKKKKEFQQWQTSFTAELGKLQGMAEQANTDPAGFMASAKKLGIDIRPVSVGGGKQVYEAYMGGRKMGQYDNLQTAAEDGIAQYTNNMFRQGAAQFATSIQDFGTLLQTSQTMDIARRNLALSEKRDARDESREAREAALQPFRVDEIRANIRESNARAAKAGYETGKLKRMDDMNAELQNLLKDPVKNADAIRSMAAQMEALFPEVYVKTGKITKDGEEVLGTVGILNPTTDKILRGAGVAPPEIVAAARSGTNPITGKPYTSAEITAFENKYPNTPWPGPQKTTTPAKGGRSAIPATGGRGAPPSAALNIPPAPPRSIQQQTRGGIVYTGIPNPNYAAWERRYGQYQAQQR